MLTKLTNRLNALKKHAGNFFPYLTPGKISNIVLSLIEKQFRVVHLKSRPFYLKIEPGPFCQLRCPTCYHNDPEYKKQFTAEDNLKKEKLARVIEPLKKTLVGVVLSHRGEPFTNPDIIELIEYLHRNNIAVSFPTNFSLPFTDEKMARLAASGLDALYVSLDGASAETYGKTRFDGDFDLILGNVKLLAECKKKIGVSRPKITWKFVVFDHNKHETEIVRTNYKKYGFDSYELVRDYYNPVFREKLEKAKRRNRLKKQNCYWLWHIVVILSNGQVNPCCNGKDFNIGNAFEDNILDLWNGETYRKLRSGFKKKNYPGEMHPFCKRCYRIE